VEEYIPIEDYDQGTFEPQEPQRDVNWMEKKEILIILIDMIMWN